MDTLWHDNHMHDNHANNHTNNHTNNDGEQISHTTNHHHHHNYHNYASNKGVLVHKGDVYSRITVRTLSADCLDFVAEWRNMPDLQQFFIYKIPVNRRMLLRWFYSMDKSRNHYYVIELHDNTLHDNHTNGGTNENTATPIGIVSVGKIDETLSGGKTAIVGLYIAYEHLRGRGIALAVMNYIHYLYFHEKNFQQLEACIHDHNKRSQKFFAKIGYEPEEVTPQHHLHQTLHTHCLELVVCTQNRWREQNQI